ncbi:50S ribosomal protein L23 [Candidatus Parcubacteria bacterium]|nr:50S ribosomal protein L23 [Candidatus Parcubacteria bacterium]
MSLVGQVIVKPIITEKSLQLAKGQNKYVFAISPRASKQEIKRAVEKLFGVTVIRVGTLWVRGEIKRRARSRRAIKTPGVRKAIVTLEGGQKIDLFEK